MRGTTMNHKDEGPSSSPIKDRVGPTRRQMLKTFARGTEAAAVGATFTRECAACGAPTSCESAPLGEGKEAVARRATAFALTDVRLLDGPRSEEHTSEL